jgi:transposase
MREFWEPVRFLPPLLNPRRRSAPAILQKQENALGEGVSNGCRFCAPGVPCRFHRKDDSAAPKQFAARRRTPLNEFDKHFEDIDPRRPGFQTTTFGQRRHRTPAWVCDEKVMLAVIQNHPQARHRWRRWFHIAWRYFRQGWSAKDIAEELERAEQCTCSTKSVQRIVEQLSARAKKRLPSAEDAAQKMELLRETCLEQASIKRTLTRGYGSRSTRAAA